MSTYVLVHGGWAGGWVWEKVTPLLAAAGHRVLAPDLPGHGADRTPVGRITLDGYVDHVAGVLDAQPEPVILVGHSSGGMVVTQAAERRPDAVHRLGYVAAIVPGDGQTLFDVWQSDVGQPLPLEVSPDGSSATMPTDAVRHGLFGDCPDADARRFTDRAVAEPLGPPATPLKLTAERAGRVPKTYLECTADAAVPLELQRRMHTAAGCGTVLSLPTGHMPMYADPGGLARRLLAMA